MMLVQSPGFVHFNSFMIIRNFSKLYSNYLLEVNKSDTLLTLTAKKSSGLEISMHRTVGKVEQEPLRLTVNGEDLGWLQLMGERKCIITGSRCRLEIQPLGGGAAELRAIRLSEEVTVQLTESETQLCTALISANLPFMFGWVCDWPPASFPDQTPGRMILEHK